MTNAMTIMNKITAIDPFLILWSSDNSSLNLVLNPFAAQQRKAPIP